jgi:hypothetical protein
VLRRFAFCISFLLTASIASAHEPKLLDARRATPGLRLEMRALSDSMTAPDAKYHLQAYGFPIGVKLLVWAKEFDHRVYQLASLFQIDKSGNIVESKSSTGVRPRKLDEMTFGPGSYPRGALWEVALVSVDRKLQAYAKVTPYPISARDGTCEIALQLVSHRGEKFLTTGSGFVPNEDVIAESQYAGRLVEKYIRILPAGVLPPHVVLHSATVPDRQARYSVKGRFCVTAVDYVWGELATSRR